MEETSLPPASPAPQTPPPATNVSDEAKKQLTAVKDKLTTLSLFKKLIAGSALAVIIFSFFPAYTFGSTLYTSWVNSLVSPLGKLSLLLSIVVGAVVVTPLFTTKLPTLPWSYEKITFIGSIVILALNTLQLLNYTFDNSPWGSPDVGLFLVCAASILMTYSAYHEQKKPVQ